MAILISYASQKEKNAKGYYANSSFLRAELEKFNSKYLGGTGALIPPAKVPVWIKEQNKNGNNFIGGIISSVSEIWKINSNEKYNVDTNYGEWKDLDDFF